MGKGKNRKLPRIYGTRPSFALPVSIPGRYFMLRYRKEGDSFTLCLDDPENDNPTFNLGSDRGEIVRRFRLWGHEDLGVRACDLAREFGASQAIFKGSRVLSLHRLRAYKPVNVFEQPQRKSYALPVLA